MSSSKKYALDKTDVTNLGKNAALVGIAAALTYVGQNLSDLDLGSMSVVAVPVISFLIDSAMKWTKSNQTEEVAGE